MEEVIGKCPDAIMSNDGAFYWCGPEKDHICMRFPPNPDDRIECNVYNDYLEELKEK